MLDTFHHAYLPLHVRAARPPEYAAGNTIVLGSLYPFYLCGLAIQNVQLIFMIITTTRSADYMGTVLQIFVFVSGKLCNTQAFSFLFYLEKF